MKNYTRNTHYLGMYLLNHMGKIVSETNVSNHNPQNPCVPFQKRNTAFLACQVLCGATVHKTPGILFVLHQHQQHHILTLSEIRVSRQNELAESTKLLASKDPNNPPTYSTCSSSSTCLSCSICSPTTCSIDWTLLPVN